MGNMFSGKEDALVWLVVKGWRQDDNGHWLKGRREAVINPSPINDGAVCVVTKAQVEQAMTAREMEIALYGDGKCTTYWGQDGDPRNGERLFNTKEDDATVEAQLAADRRAADRIDGYDRDDLGESPDY